MVALDLSDAAEVRPAVFAELKPFGGRAIRRKESGRNVLDRTRRCGAGPWQCAGKHAGGEGDAADDDSDQSHEERNDDASAAHQKNSAVNPADRGAGVSLVPATQYVAAEPA